MVDLIKLMKTNKVQFVGTNSEMIFETWENTQNSNETVEIYIWDDNFGWVLCGEV